MFTSCWPHHPFWLGLCWEDLLFSFACYLFTYLLLPLKMKLKSPVRTHTKAHTNTGICTLPHASTNKTTTCCAEAYERAQTFRPTFDLASSHPQLHFLSLGPRLHLLSFLFSYCKCGGRQCFVFMLYFVLFCFCFSIWHFFSPNLLPEVFHIFNILYFTAQFPLSNFSFCPRRHLAPRRETPLRRPPPPQFIFPAHTALVLLLLPLLSFLKAASPPSTEWLPESPFGQDEGSVWSIAEENKGGPRQVNEARRQLCAKLHQYSIEASLPCSSNNILVIWVSHITVPLWRVHRKRENSWKF